MDQDPEPDTLKQKLKNRPKDRPSDRSSDRPSIRSSGKPSRQYSRTPPIDLVISTVTIPSLDKEKANVSTITVFMQVYVYEIAALLVVLVVMVPFLLVILYWHRYHLLVVVRKILHRQPETQHKTYHSNEVKHCAYPHHI